MLLQPLQSGARPLQASPLPSSRLHCSSWHGTLSTRRLVPARPQQHSPSRTLVLCHAKRGTSSSKGRRNDDEELARQAMRAMEALGASSSPQVPSRKRGGDARVASMNAEFQATKARKQPSLAEALDAIEAAASPPAATTAEMLYGLGTALSRERAGMQEGRVASAVAKLTALMLEVQESSSSSVTQRVQQLKGKELNLSAWALSKVQPIRGTEVTQLGLALTEQALHGSAMDAEGWRGWSGLLFGLAKAGMSCQSNVEVQHLFRLAVTQRLPELLMQGQACNAQDVSNTLLACSKAGYTMGDLQVLVFALDSPAGVRILHADNAKPQAISNVVWALADLKFYNVGLFSAASSALLEKCERSNGHDLSNLFDGCAEAQHWDSSMERLASAGQSAVQLGKWNAQDISNALHSWAVLRAVGAATASPGFTTMAQQLFSQATRMGVSAFINNVPFLCQLYLAHRVAMHVGLPGGGLSDHPMLLQASCRSYEAATLGLKNKVRRTASLEQEIAAAMQHAGYDVERAVVIGSECMQLLAQGVAVRVVDADDYFRAPPGLLRGSSAVHGVLASWVCKGSVVISEAEWANLKGDTQRQKAFVVQRLQQALNEV